MKKDLIFVIFGSTGDLTARKLLPALTKLYKSGQINQNLGIIALGRRDFTTKSYLEYMNSLADGNLEDEILSKLVTYYQMEISKCSDYKSLADYLALYKSAATKVIYYLAVTPELLPTVALSLSTQKLVSHNNLNEAIVFEKPFGNDLTSAKEINQLLFKYFDERQIYRIDHYLGKEVIQNIMTIRFANRLFDTLWDSNNILDIKIVAKEKDGILTRAGYYDQSGALKDMVQSHLLQMLCLIAMDAPLSYSSEDIKDQKVKVLQSLTFNPNDIIFGQYQDYLDEANIKSDSQTETFAFLKLAINNKRLKGVPVYLMTGKKLESKQTYIEITFKPTNHQLQWSLPLDSNKLLISVDPVDTVKISVNSKEPGLNEAIKVIDLTYETPPSLGIIHEAYEKLFLDITNGNRTLFTRWDEIEYSWQLIDQIKSCEIKLERYPNYQYLTNLIKEKFNLIID